MPLDMQTHLYLSTQQRLKTQLLDTTWKSLDATLRGVCAEMILNIHNEQACWDVLAQALRCYADCDRVDAGRCTRSDAHYSPCVQAARADVPMPNVVGLQLPNQTAGVQWLWHNAQPLVTSDLHADSRLDRPLVALLRASGTQALVSLAVQHAGTGVGVVCLDHVTSARQWRVDRVARLFDFVQQAAAPVLAAAQALKTAHSHPASLSPAEARVAAIAATGAGYKVIARRLNKSASTVDHQLRSIRRKLQAQSHAHLVLVLNTPGSAQQ